MVFKSSGLLLIITMLFLSGCESTKEIEKKEVVIKPAPIPDDLRMPVPDYTYIPSPNSAPERARLNAIYYELGYVQQQVREAQAQSPGKNVVGHHFDYNEFFNSIDELRFGIRNYLGRPNAQPRPLVLPNADTGV